MKSLNQFINEDFAHKSIAKLEEELHNLNKEQVFKDFKDKDLRFNVGNKMITFIGNEKEDQQTFYDKVIAAIQKCNIDFKRENLEILKGNLNNEKQPVVYIGLKDYLESIKKDLEN